MLSFDFDNECFFIWGDVVIQNVMNATKILWNADIPEVAVFRDG